MAADWATEALDISLPMRDGKQLAGDLDLPAEEGRIILLAETAQRASLVGSHRKKLDPGREHNIEILFPSHAHRFAKGHRVALIIASGNAPRYQPNPQNGESLYERGSSLAAHVSIRHGETPRTAGASCLTLPKRR